MMMMGVMEAQEEAANLCQDQLQIIKGKRTKRPRPMASTTTSSGGETEGEGGRINSGFDPAVIASPTTSAEFAEGSEEEDMANCLILLAQGRTRKQPSDKLPVSVETISKTTTSTTTKTEIYVHQCKTCNRCFPSFQALGGHRASHKKPKIVNEDDNNKNNNKGLPIFFKENHQFNNTMNTTLSLQLSNKSVICNSISSSKLSKVHECSICGAEFSSGQALGGHMRRHRTLITNNNAATTATPSLMSVVDTRSSPESEESKKQRNVLQLDLNLPAPEDNDHHHNSRESKFPFASPNEKLLVFSASNLVDCHY